LKSQGENKHTKSSPGGRKSFQLACPPLIKLCTQLRKSTNTANWSTGVAVNSGIQNME